MIKEKIGIIGLGNMGTALAQGLKKTKVISAQNIWLFDKEGIRLNSIVEKLGFNKASSNQELVAKSQGIILAVKPKDIAPVLEEVKERLNIDKFIISIAAGITISFLEKRINKELPIIRVMPNTPSRIGAGITAFSFSRLVNSRHKEMARFIFQAFGEVVEVEEEAMDLVTALSGSGPAYFFLIMEALIKAGRSLGLEEDIAEKLVKETALGAAKLAKGAPESLSQLREEVTSPGGTTEAALKVFKEGNIDKLVFQAVEAAKQKSIKLSQT